MIKYLAQWRAQKARIGADTILLFRIGDFYETFGDDAKIIARVLGLTLTVSGRHTDEPLPLAGVPYHAVERYIQRLVRAGFKVAVSDYISESAGAP